MKPFIQFFAACLVVAFSSCRVGNNVSDKEVEQYAAFVAEMQARGFNTGNILVYRNGEIIFESANGLRTVNPIDSLTLESQFRIASVSKQFTGVAIMKLKQAGKLDYDQKVNTILTDFPYDDITIRHLLNHTSGLGDDEELIDEYFVPQDSASRNIIGNMEILEVLYKVKPELYFQPGEGWEYSNMGYTVLASVVEKVSNLHFRDYLDQEIFEPLELNNTVLYEYQEVADRDMPNRVFGYRKALNQKDLLLDDYHLINDVRGSGGIYSTIEDLYSWNLALMNYEVLPKAYLDEAWSWGALNNGEKVRYGFGWKFLEDEATPNTVFHAGGWVGFGAYLYNEIDTRSGYVVLTNDSWESFIAITDAIDSIRVGAPYVLQKKSIGREVSEQLFAKDLDEALSFYRQHKLDTFLYNVDVFELNNLGYDLLYENYTDEALAVFELNIREYPSVAGVYDSYGDAFLAKGDTLKALENIKIAYRMDGDNDYFKEKILSLERE